MATSYAPLGKAEPNDQENIKKIWNGKKLCELRQELLEGNWPEQCSACKNLEKNGGLSQRIFINKRFEGISEDLVKNTKENGQLEVLPNYYGLRFSNLCNFSCRICDADLSTSWYPDYELLGRKHPEGVQKVFNSAEDIKNYFSPYLENLKWVYFAGGEPLITPEHLIFLKFLIESKKIGSIKLLYNTNLSSLNFKDTDFVEYWKTFEHVTINASLDAIGVRAEYLRYGQNWAKTELNLKRLLREKVSIDLVFTPVISLHNIFHLDEYFEYFFEMFDATPGHFVLDPLTSPSYFSITNLPESLKVKVEGNMNKIKKKMIYRFGLEQSSSLLVQLLALKKYMWGEGLEWDKFLEETKAIDKVRNQNYREIFTEYSEYF